MRTYSFSCLPRRREPAQCNPGRVNVSPAPNWPDLALYSQEEQFALGQAPSWDNPDITTSTYAPLRLMPETIVAVRNLSKTSAIGAVVSLSISDFGIGMPRDPETQRVVNVGPLTTIVLNFPLSQQVLAQPDQRIGAFIAVEHPFDRRAINNRGAQMIAEVSTTKIGRKSTLVFPVRNTSPANSQVTLGILPNWLQAILQTQVVNLPPLAQASVAMDIDVPASFHGTLAAPLRADVTVVGRLATGSLLGGLTYVVWIDD